MPPKKELPSKKVQSPTKENKDQVTGYQILKRDQATGSQTQKKDHITSPQMQVHCQILLDYLRQQNRPYSAIDISANLHNAVPKAAVPKLLKEMHESEVIEGRVSGKQIVYHAIQDPNAALSPETLQAMDAEMQQLNKEIKNSTIALKEQQTMLNTLLAAPCAAELHNSLASVHKRVVELEKTLEPLRKGLRETVDPKKVIVVEEEHDRLERMFRLRKDTYQEFWAAIKDMYQGDTDELWDQIGLEDDDL